MGLATVPGCEQLLHIDAKVNRISRQRDGKQVRSQMCAPMRIRKIGLAIAIKWREFFNRLAGSSGQ